MRVALLHNASAGREDHDERKLQKLIRGAGHEVVHRVRHVSELTAALHEEPCDLVVVAGGDGTVGRAACALSGWNVPISILPLGTANNTARTLDLSTDHEQTARGWHRGRPVPFDIGLVSDGSVRQRFAEVLGWGVFPSVITQAEKMRAKKSVARKLVRDRKLFRTVTRTAPACDYRIELDGKDLSGSYLLVEVMNVPLLGPRLPLSPSSDPADGVFELVLASEEHRGALEELASEDSEASAPALRVERGARLSVETSDAVMHCDGRIWRHPVGSHRYEIDVDPGAVQYLADRGAGSITTS
jgi:diacylglycerol kinase family enzyme